MRLLIPCLFLLVTACSSPVYKLSINQGNYVDDKKLAQVETGMSAEQVLYLLGTPLVVDEFQPDRWDYVSFVRAGDGSEHRRVVSLYFDAGRLARIEDSRPPAASPADTADNTEA